MLARMVDYIHWSNAQLIAWAREQNAIDTEQIRLLSHILNAADIWIARCKGTDVNKEIFRVHRLEDMAAIKVVILHVFTHGFHHQGQIAAMASKLGITPPSVAFITYTRIMHPEAPG